jgi:hypothetical protein
VEPCVDKSREEEERKVKLQPGHRAVENSTPSVTWFVIFKYIQTLDFVWLIA